MNSGNQMPDRELREAVEAGASHRRAILSWTEVRCQTSVGKPATRVYTHLRSHSLIGDPIAPEFVDKLCYRFRCVTDLARRVENSNSLAIPTGLAEWVKWSKRLVSQWPPSTEYEWEALLIECAEDDNRVVNTCVSQSLWESVQEHPVSAELSANVQELAGMDAEYWSEFPIPPAVGKSLRADNYILLATQRGFFMRLEETWEQLNAMLDELRRRDPSLESTQPKVVPSVSRQCLTDGDYLSAVNQMWDLLQYANTGWPVELISLGDCLTRISERLNRCASRNKGQHAGLPESVWSLLRDMNALGAELGYAPEVATSDRSDETSLLDSGSSTGNPISWPSEVHGPSDADMGEKPGSLPQDLRDLAHLLHQIDDHWAIDFARQLETLCRSSEGDQGHECDFKLRRKVLICLIQMDELLVRQAASLPWLVEARARLRQFFFVDHDYELLESQLLGRPVESCAKLVETVGSVDDRVASRYIAYVQQPGYFVTRSDGSQEVLLPAKVVLRG